MTERIAVARGVDELQVALATDGAFEAWYRRTLPRVYSYLLSRCGSDAALAEELTQQTFIAAIEAVALRRTLGHGDVAVRDRSPQARRSLPDARARRASADASRGSRDPSQRMSRATVRTSTIVPPSRKPSARCRRPNVPSWSSSRSTISPSRRPARLVGKSPVAAQSLLHRARDGFRRAYREDRSDD